MWRRLCVLVVVAGCWSDDPQVNGLTADQWDHFANELALHGLGSNGCKGIANCMDLAHFGQELFFEPAMSTRVSNGMLIPGSISCMTCHDPNKKWFIDSRNPNNVSQGATGPTGHNSMSVANLELKYDLQKNDMGFGWTGQYKSAIEVIDNLAIPKAMSTDEDTVLAAIKANAWYADEASRLWPGHELTFADIDQALDVYMRQLISLDSDFDAWIAGDENKISDSAKRGFVIFVGKGGCVSCHSGPAFSDRWVHVTGLKQKYTDDGLGSAATGSDAADFEGDFATQSLRNIARTAPYMHDGSLATLEDVVAFYRRGGDPGGYTGVKDPRIQPLDLTDDDAADLVEFLKTLNGAPIQPDELKDIHPTVTCMPDTLPCNETCCGPNEMCDNGMCVMQSGCMMPPLTQCATGCTNLMADYNHCGDCGHMCGPMESCEMGTCMPSMCPPLQAPCGNVCTDLLNDRNNCGACGLVCPTSCVNGACG